MVMAGCGDDAQPPVDAAGTAMLVPSTSDGTIVTSLALPDTAVGQDATATLTLTNNGDAATGPIALAISGTAANDFGLDNALTSCAAKSLAPTESCDVAIAFHPTVQGDRAAELAIIADPGAMVTIGLSGKAFVFDLSLSPAPVDLGTIEIGHPAQATVTLTNTGTSAAPIDNIAVSGAAFSRGISTCGPQLAAGESCDIVVTAAPTTFGSATGTLTVTSGGNEATADLTASGARRITIVTHGTGTGTVTSSPAGISCGGTCTALFDGDVTLTAAPGADSVLTGWSVTGCGTASTCTITADAAPLTVDVGFTLTGSSELDIAVTGTGTGEVLVRNTNGDVLATCFSSCAVPVQPGVRLTLTAATSSIFGGITGACIGASTSAECSFTPGVGTSTATVSFTKDTHEGWSRLVFPGEQFIAIAHDGSGNVVAATAQHLVKLTSTGTTVWTRAMVVSGLATGPSDSIYVVSGTNVMKLDSTGADVWTQPLDANSTTDCTTDGNPGGQCIAVGPSGEVVVHGTGITRWDASGTMSFSTALMLASPGVAIDPGGVIYVSVENSNGEARDARRFMPDGTEIASFTSVANQYIGEFAIDSTGLLVTSSSGHSNVWLVRTLATGMSDYRAMYAGTFASYVLNGLSTSAVGRIAWWHYLTDGGIHDQYRISVIQNDNTPVWSLDRARFFSNDFGDLGTYPNDMSYAGSQVVIGGRYLGLTFNGGWLQSYTP